MIVVPIKQSPIRLATEPKAARKTLRPLVIGLASLMIVLAIGAGILVLFLSKDSRFAIEIVGPEETVFDWDRDACNPDDTPDLPARAFRDANGLVHLISGHFYNRWFSGRGLNQVRRRCDVVLSSSFDADPAKFNDREWISSLYTKDGQTVFALVHNEYQGNTHGGRLCSSMSYFKCWYNAVTLAVSRDGGRTFSQPLAPSHLVAAIPQRYRPNGGQAGLFSPTNIVHRRSDGFYYSMVHVARYDGQRGVCLMRTKRLAVPNSWRAWDGNGFDVAPMSPYQKRANVESCVPVSRKEIHEMSSSLTFNTYLDRFVLVGVSTGSQSQAAAIWGVYFSTSRDLLHWSEPQLIRAAEFPWTFQCGNRDPILYPSILDPSSASKSFETVGQRAYLYFTRLHYRNCRLSLDRDLIRVPIQFSR